MSVRYLAASILFAAACGGSTGEAPDRTEDAVIEIEYIAHAAFLFRAEDGTELLIDPYASRVWLGYDWPPGIEPAAILITHAHYDHDAGRFRGQPFPWSDMIPVVDAPGVRHFGDFTVTGIEGRHADPYGKEFGQRNTLMVVEAHGVRIAHLGDNGPLTPSMLAGLGRVDILLMPGDGVDHILSQTTTAEIIAALDPRVVIPMHYRLADLEVDLESPSDLGEVDPWLEGRAPVRRMGSHIASYGRAALPVGREYVVLDHAPYVAARK